MSFFNYFFYGVLYGVPSVALFVLIAMKRNKDKTMKALFFYSFFLVLSSIASVLFISVINNVGHSGGDIETYAMISQTANIALTIGQAVCLSQFVFSIRKEQADGVY